MKSLQYIFISIVVLSVAALLAVMVTARKNESRDMVCAPGAYVCPDGSWVSRGGPNCSYAECPPVNETVPDDVSDHIQSKANLIVVTSPLPNTHASSPIRVTGEARGNWFFEATFPIDVVDWDGRIIGSGYATADGEWMTTEFVPFTATVTYSLPAEEQNARGTIILRKDNPSGLPEHDDALEIPVFLR